MTTPPAAETMVEEPSVDPVTRPALWREYAANLRAQIARDEEHYQAAMTMGEKHRRNWVEACQERERLREALAEAVKERDELKNVLQLATSDLTRNGKNILDFFNVWLDQERQDNANLRSQLSTAQAEAARVRAETWPEEPTMEILKAAQKAFDQLPGMCASATMWWSIYKAMRAAHLSALPATVSKLAKGEEGKA